MRFGIEMEFCDGERSKGVSKSNEGPDDRDRFCFGFIELVCVILSLGATIFSTSMLITNLLSIELIGSSPRWPHHS